MTNVIIADNQYITASGTKFLLQSDENVRSVKEIGTKNELVDYLVSHNEDVLIVLDYTLYDFYGANDLLNLGERFPYARWLLFSEELSVDFLKPVLYSECLFGVILKSSEADEINVAFRLSVRGERFICNRVSNILLDTFQPSKERPDRLLSITEKKILKEVALGKTTKEIAAERNLSVHTVVTHRKNIFRKLEVNNVHEATKYAMRAGIINVAEYCI